MKARESLSFLFIFGYAVFMLLFGYLGRNSFVGGASTIFLTLFAAGFALAMFWAIWNLDIKLVQRENQAVDKRKREPIEGILRDMSKSDIQRLKRRLSDSDFAHKAMIDDEGELIYGDRR